MKKCCITCAFCLKKVKYLQYGFAKIMDNGQKANLYMEEVVSALNEDFSFLSKEKDSYEKWHNTYAEKKEAKRKKDIAEKEAFGNILPKNFKSLFPSVNNKTSIAQIYMAGDKSRYNDYKELGINTPPPDDVEYSALCCEENCWEQIKNTEIAKLKERTLPETDCEFYFPLEKKYEKSLNVCRKEREAYKQKNRDKLKEEEIEIAKKSLAKSEEALIESQKTKTEISKITKVLDEAKDITKEIATYTKENQKSSEKQFKASIIISIIALIVALTSLVSGVVTSNKTEKLMMDGIKKQDNILKVLKKNNNNYKFSIFQIELKR